MNKTITLAKPQAVAAAKPWPTQKQVIELASDADELVALHNRVNNALRFQPQHQNLDDLQELLDEYDDNSRRELVNRFEFIEPAEWRDDEDYEVQRPAVSKMLAVLVGSFPTSNLPDAGVFTKVMLDDVMALEPSFLELEAACRKLRRSQRFMPSISEIVEAVEAERAGWQRRVTGMHFLPGKITKLKELVEAERTRRAAAEDQWAKDADRRRRQAELDAQPFATGQTVHHRKFGEGVVTSVEDNKVTVSFSIGSKVVVDSFLNKVLA